MKKTFWILVLLSLLPFATAHAWQGKVVKVLDGDSLKIKRGKELVEVRLYGVDCPEWDQAYGKKAKEFTKEQLLHKRVEVDPMDTDSYGRTVAMVSSSGKMINRQVVRAGLAWYYKKYCKKKPFCSELNTLEKEAKKQRRGLWQEKKPTAPWKWRKKQKSRKK
ncbi:MAG: nuclease [Candidatus Electrothrix sp. AR3]|nr:nuclease [Candidatus Electrothrix sp. AR3]